MVPGGGESRAEMVDRLVGARFVGRGAELDLLAATLSAESVAVLAGRNPPERGWSDDLAHVATDRLLGPLSEADARELRRWVGPIFVIWDRIGTARAPPSGRFGSTIRTSVTAADERSGPWAHEIDGADGCWPPS